MSFAVFVCIQCERHSELDANVISSGIFLAVAALSASLFETFEWSENHLSRRRSLRLAFGFESFILIWRRDERSLAKAELADTLNSIPNKTLPRALTHTHTHTINKRFHSSHELLSSKTLSFLLGLGFAFFRTKEYHNHMALWVAMPLALWC